MLKTFSSCIHSELIVYSGHKISQMHNLISLYETITVKTAAPLSMTFGLEIF